MRESLLTRPELKDSKRQVDDYIILTSQLAADEFEDAYERLENQPSEQLPSTKVAQLTSIENLKRIVRQLEDVYSDSFLNRLKREDTFNNYSFLIKLSTQDE